MGVGSGFHSTSVIYVSIWRRQNEVGILPLQIADRQCLVGVELNGAVGLIFQIADLGVRPSLGCGLLCVSYLTEVGPRSTIRQLID